MDNYYGEDVEFRVEEEDRDPITKPIIQQISKKTFIHRIPPYKDEFLLSLMKEDHAIRNVALIGNFFHGKTTFIDCLVSHLNFEPKKFTDALFMEQERSISVKASPVSLVMQNLRGKSYALNILDTPGHVNFSDEVTSALRLTDGVVVIVDASEGVMLNTKLLVKHALQQNQSLTLCINKIDKLIFELRLPPNDAYHKLNTIIADINDLISTYSNKSKEDTKYLSPLLGNVCFASSEYSVCFSLKSFAKLTIERCKSYNINYKQLAAKLWGDCYFVKETRKFEKFDKPPSRTCKRSFVEFILEPIYKFFRVAIEDPDTEFVQLVEDYKITLPKSFRHMNVRSLLKAACSSLFGTFQSFVDMCVEFIPSPKNNSSNKIPMIWSGPNDSPLTTALLECDSEGPLILQVVKQYLSTDGSTFNVFGQVLSGTIFANSRVLILGESYTKYDDEDSRVMQIGRLWINNTRFETEVKSVVAGNWVLIEGIEQPVVKTCTIIGADSGEEPYIFRPLKFNNKPFVKIAAEPKNPSELPKMLEGLRKCSKSYPILQTKVEESGEHVLIGTGELYLDCVMHDLRRIYTEIDIRVSDPVVCFSETVTATSEDICVAETPNKKNTLKMIAEPLERGLASSLEEEKIKVDSDQKNLSKFFKSYGWDDLSCRSIWAFGPEVNSTNILLNETFSYEVDTHLLSSIKEPIVQAFHWATREGPLCEEPIRSVKFMLTHAEVAKEFVHRSSGQIIPTSRRLFYLSFLKASPRMMEPQVMTEIIAPLDVVEASTSRSKTLLEEMIVDKRRGRITKKAPLPGTILYRVTALMPAIDSFGFETDLRIRTTGQAFCQSVFHSWVEAPGDPLDTTIDDKLTQLEPQLTEHLAREFLLKTRRRKGLCDEVIVEKFIDDAMRQSLATQEVEDDFDFS